MVKYSVETKLKAVSLYQNEIGTREIRARLGIKSDSLIYPWIEQYKKHGKKGLKTKRTKNKYSGQFKLEVLNWRKQHNESYQKTAAHFNISNIGTIANWQRVFSQSGIGALNVKLGRPPFQNKKAKYRFHQKFKTDRPYQKIVTDISEFRYGKMTIHDRVYLSPFKDLCSGEIISYTTTDSPKTKYVLEGLNKVFESRTEGLKYRMTVHSDQGVQYQSNIYRHTLRKHRVFQSMSRRATCHDNAAMESFFHIMKVEMNYFTHHFETKKQLVKAMKE